MRPKTYGFKILDFLCQNNVVKIESEQDLEDLRSILKKLNLQNILWGDTFSSFKRLMELAKLNSRNEADQKLVVCLEYDNEKGVTFYTNTEDPESWYGCKPLTVKEILKEIKTAE